MGISYSNIDGKSSTETYHLSLRQLVLTALLRIYGSINLKRACELGQKRNGVRHVEISEFLTIIGEALVFMYITYLVRYVEYSSMQGLQA